MVAWSSEDSDMAGSQEAMIRAGKRAAELARQYDQPLAVWRDGKVVYIDPHDLAQSRQVGDASHES